MIIWRESSESTNTELAALARDGAAPGTALATLHQTGGKGRLGRQWTAPAGTSLALSVLLDVSHGAEVPIPLLGGLAVFEELTLLAPGSAALGVKWPNDVLIGERKVAGILGEYVGEGKAVLGIGLNTVMGVDDLPTETATSLLVSGIVSDDFDHGVFVSALRKRLLSLVAGYDDVAQAALIRGRIEASSATIGRRVRIELPDGVSYEARATGYEAGGQLRVQRDDGSIQTLSSGDVFHVRHADAEQMRGE